MKLIDFDAYFTDALNTWIDENSHRFKRPEDMEDAAPDVYVKWLDAPADWLEGKTPGTYFDQFEDAQALVALLKDYCTNGVPIPDPLLDRIAELNDEAAVMGLLKDAAAPGEARMHAIELLRQMESTAPMVDYIRWQVERDLDEDLLDNALESLREMGEAVRRPAKIAFTAADDIGKEALLDVLADFPGDDDVFTFALRQLKSQKDKHALYAGYLGKLDDDRALEALLDMCEGKDISYIDFIELRNAIERLGGEAPVRDFEDDPTYIAVKQLQTR